MPGSFIVRGHNEDEIADFAAFAREHDIKMRFIEFMPLDAGHDWSRDDVFSGREIRRCVEAKARAGVILMHSRGSREMLHKQRRMNDPVHEVAEDLARSLGNARAADIPADTIVIDPGIGFGKTADESLAILKSLRIFSTLGYPLLVGTSRKSFIRSVVSDSPEARNWGTAAAIVASIVNGAHIVRVHDVRQARVLADVSDRILLGAL